MTATLIPTALLALTEGFAAALPDVAVTLGMHHDETPGTRLWVGYDPESDFSPAATSRLEIATMGQRSRDEVAEVNCTLHVERADGDTEASVIEARDVLDAISAWLLTAQFVALPQVVSAVWGASTEMRLVPTAYGSGVLLSFSVAFKARHTT